MHVYEGISGCIWIIVVFSVMFSREMRLELRIGELLHVIGEGSGIGFRERRGCMDGVGRGSMNGGKRGASAESERGKHRGCYSYIHYPSSLQKRKHAPTRSTQCEACYL